MLKSFLGATASLAVLALPALAEDLSIGHAKGDENAPLTIIEYGSVTCSTCKFFHDELMPRLEADYIETGKVRFIFREVLRNDLDVALVSIARCAGEENFFEITDAVFDRQAEIFDSASAGTAVDTFVDLGTPYGITDAEAFDACYGNMDVRLDMIEVQETMESYDIPGTPTLVVNGTEKHFDADLRTADAFVAYLDAQLAALPETPDEPAE